jgi:hypothetical protein
MEGVTFRVKEMVEQIYLDADLLRPGALRVDGGAASNNYHSAKVKNTGIPKPNLHPFYLQPFSCNNRSFLV